MDSVDSACLQQYKRFVSLVHSPSVLHLSVYPELCAVCYARFDRNVLASLSQITHFLLSTTQRPIYPQKPAYSAAGTNWFYIELSVVSLSNVSATNLLSFV
jgi:hypothetical protein